MARIVHERHRVALAAAEENQTRAEGFRQYVLRTLTVANIALDYAALDYVLHLNHGSKLPSNVDPTSRRGPLAGVVLQQGTKELTAEGEARQFLTNEQLTRVRKEMLTGRLKAYVSGPVWVPSTHEYLVAVSRPFGDLTGTAWLRPRSFTDFADEVKFSKDDLISLIGLDGITRARRTGNRFSTGEDLQGTLVMKMQGAHPNGSYVGPSSVDRVPHYFSHRRLPEYGLFATSGISSRLVQTKPTWRESLYWIPLVLASIAIVICGLVLAKSSARKRLQVANLGQANRRFAAAQRLASVGDWNYDFRSGLIQWSANLYEMYQRPVDQTILDLNDLSQYFDSENQLRIHDALERIVTTGEGIEYILEARLPDGSITSHNIVAAPTRNEDGEITGAHGTDQDISARRRLELLEAQIANHSRTEAMNALAATLAHELNQPLAAAANYLAAAVRLLSKKTDFDANYCLDIIRSAEQQIHDTGDIIKGARELVSNEAKISEPVSLRPVVAEALHLLEGLEGFDKLTVQIEMSNELEVLARKSQLRQVFFNLLKNGFEAAHNRETPEIRIASFLEPNDCVRIEVRDNGAGISSEEGDPFSSLATTKATGLGLGLSIARTIVEAHGGSIWILETSPHGTIVGFTLPVAH